MIDPTPEMSREELRQRYARPVAPAEAAGPRSPFKFLDPYGAGDRGIYFGRESELRELAAQFHSFGHVVVYGESGTGKSSLLQCGLQARFPEEDALFVTLRLHDLSPAALCRKIADQVSRRIDEPFEPTNNGDLAECLREATAASSLPLVLIIEQFEELFTRHDRAARNRFAEELARVARTRLNVMLIMVVQQEFLARLSELEPIVQGLFDNRFWLPPMSQDAASRAVAQACLACELATDEGVVDSIVARMDPQGRGVNLPSLQIALDGLYQQAVEDNPTTPRMTTAAAAGVGGAKQVLESFVHDAVESVSDGDAARHLLGACVTENGDAIPVDLRSLSAEGSGISSSRIATARHELVDAGLLRPTDEPEIFELRHQVLGRPILNWLLGAVPLAVPPSSTTPPKGRGRILSRVLGIVALAIGLLYGAERYNSGNLKDLVDSTRTELEETNDELEEVKERLVEAEVKADRIATQLTQAMQQTTEAQRQAEQTAMELTQAKQQTTQAQQAATEAMQIAAEATEREKRIASEFEKAQEQIKELRERVEKLTSLPPAPPKTAHLVGDPPPPVTVPSKPTEPTPGAPEIASLPPAPPMSQHPNGDPPRPVPLPPGGPESSLVELAYFVMSDITDVEVSQKLTSKGPFTEGEAEVSLTRLTHLAHSINPLGESPPTEERFLTWYRVKQEAPEAQRVVVIKNQFGTQRVFLGPPVGILVPATRTRDGVVPAGTHYKGYAVLDACPFRGEQRQDLQQVGENKVVTRRPGLLCLPIETTRNGETAGVDNPQNCLAFYRNLDERPTTPLEVKDEFGVNQLDPHNGSLFGVPSILLSETLASEQDD